MSVPNLRFAALISSALLASPFFCQAASWLPITDEERALTQSEIDPNAGAEVLYKSLLLDDEQPENSYREFYLRIKIYDERGAESLGKYRITYHTGSSRLGSHSARIVKADGSIREVGKAEFYEQNLQNERFGSVRARAFSFPELEAGDIVDIKYRINLLEYYYQPELFLTFQERWPLRRADVKVRPATWVDHFTYIKWMTSRCDSRGMKQNAKGFYELTVENFPAHIEEPHQPPEKNSVAWLLFYLAPNGKQGDDYWKSEGIKMYRLMNSRTKPGSQTKAALASALDGVSGDEEQRLQALYRYCVTEIPNATHSEPDMLTPKQRKEIDGNMTAEKILSQGYGNRKNINTVFCAMARAAGFDARLAALSSRDGYRFSKVLTSIDTTMKRRCIAVKLGEKWAYFDPGGKYPPFGELDWNEQGVAALIADKKNLILEAVTFGPPETSMQKGIATMELSEKGTLFGKVNFEFSGHYGVTFKRAIDGLTPKERVTFVKEAVEEIWPRASISAVEIENAASPIAPLKFSCDVSIVDYAESIGDRLFVQVNMFEESADPEFPTCFSRIQEAKTSQLKSSCRIISSSNSDFRSEGKAARLA